jgi:hypothetical protein
MARRMTDRKLHICQIAATVILIACSTAHAGWSEGGAFKSPGYGARAWGLGGAAVATVNDESAVQWNPAMLGLLESNTVGASYINIVPGATAKQSQLAYARVIKRSGRNVEGITVARHAAGILFTNLQLGIQSGESYDENTIRLAYAYTPDFFVTFAIGIDLFASSSEVRGFDGKGSSVDGALRVILTENFSVGLVARNAFSRLSYNDGGDFRKEREFQLGLSSKSIERVTIEGDVMVAHGKLARWMIGAESEYLFNVLSLRAGYALIRPGESRTVPYFGFGARVSHVSVHYNANLDKEYAFSDTHRFTLSVSL